MSERPDRRTPTRLRPSDLSGLVAERRIPGRNTTKADLIVYSVEGRLVAVKDYGPRPWWIRQTIGRWSTRREARAYLAATGVPGLPEFLGRIDRFRLATAWVDAAPFAQAGFGATEVERARTIVDDLHRRGVALSDLHHRDLLVATDGSVTIVDLAMAWVAGPRPGPFRRFVFERCRAADRVALARLGARAEGTDPDVAAAAIDPRGARWHRLGRRLRAGLDRMRRRSRR